MANATGLETDGRFRLGVPTDRTVTLTYLQAARPARIRGRPLSSRRLAFPVDGVPDVWRLARVQGHNETVLENRTLPTASPVGVAVVTPGGVPVANATVTLASTDGPRLRFETGDDGRLIVPRPTGDRGRTVEFATGTNLTVTVAGRVNGSAAAVTTTAVVGEIDERRVRLTASAPAPLADRYEAPTDPDADGRYEDVDGDGRVSVRDVAALLAALETVEDAAFDFSGDGSIDIVDAATLLDRL